MAKRLFCSDIEGDDLLDQITKVWCVSFQELDTKMMTKGKIVTFTGYVEIMRFFSNPDHLLVMHNGVAFDGPAIEKVLNIKVEAEIIDTLYLSWYLYPKMLRHGLAVWGEILGIKKVEIEDWEGLTIEEYIERCEVDVQIQTALWQQMWKHLMLLYRTPQGCWHAIRHLNFKAKCASMQEATKWKLDVPAAEKAEVMFSGKFDMAKDALEQRMPTVPVYAIKTRPKKCWKANGDLSATGKRWHDLVQFYVDPEDYNFGNPVEYDGEIRAVTKRKPANAGSHVQMKAWLDSLGWVPEIFDFKRNKETNEVRQVPQIKDKDSGELCDSIKRLIKQESALQFLDEMSIVKHRLGVVKGLLKHVDEDGYVVAAIQGLTNTLRFKHKICVNLPSGRKPYGELIRGLLQARNDKMELCGSDMSSLEDRTKQHYMWKHDPDYVTEMLTPGFDPHIDMAMEASLMNADEAAWYKKHKKVDPHDMDEATKTEFFRLDGIRHGGKGTNYSATYGAKGKTIARTANVSEEKGEALYEAYWARNWSLTAIADECIVKNSRGMSWLWNPVAKMWYYLKKDKDRFSTLNQGTGTYAFDRWVYYILQQRPQLTAQFHDEVVLELRKGNREKMLAILKSAIKSVNEELKLNRDLDCDAGFGKTYAEVH